MLAFSSDENQERYHSLIDELRCPKCQNQNLADSDAPIANDLRKQLFQMLEDGKTNQQILDYMTARYGSFVPYKPPLNMHTVILWSLPIVVFVLGATGITAYLRRNAAQRSSLQKASLTQTRDNEDQTSNEDQASKELDEQIHALRDALKQPAKEESER